MNAEKILIDTVKKFKTRNDEAIKTELNKIEGIEILDLNKIVVYSNFPIIFYVRLKSKYFYIQFFTDDLPHIDVGRKREGYEVTKQDRSKF